MPESRRNFALKSADKVERGDKIGEADGFMSVPIHASAAGTVMDIDWWPHPDGTWPSRSSSRLTDLRRRSRALAWFHIGKGYPSASRAGSTGRRRHGSAAQPFQLHADLAPPKDHPVHTLIINGAECEPYLTSDHRTMVEYPERVHFGIRVMMHAMGVKKRT